MPTFREAVEEAIRAGYCGTVRREPGWFAGLRRLIVDPDSGLGDAADTFNRLICNSPDNAEDDFPEPPFAGGQCPVAYNVTVQYSDVLSGTPRSFSATREVIGPVLGLGPFSSSDGELSILTATGNSRTGLVTIPFPCVTDPTNFTNCSAQITSIVRTDGFPDDCGDPPPIFPEPGPIVVNPPDIVYDPDTGPSITVPIGIIYAPVVVTANGTITIPVTVDVGGINLDGSFDLFPNAEINLFPNGLFGGGGTADNPALTDPEPGSEGQDEPEDEPGPDETIIAVVVRSNKDGFTRASEVTQDSLPTLYAPRLGNVSFRIRNGSLTAWTPPQPIQFTDQHIPCPSPYGALDVAVWWDSGWEGSFTPIRGRPIGTLR